ncbi:sugar transferase [Patescibacteria group bacterium]|nr:sugar transferase [Patescibacteria group bacterium]
MKKSEIFFSTLLVPVDYAMIVLASLVAYSLRFGSTVSEIRPVVYEIPFAEFFDIVLVVAVFWLGIFAISGLYAMKGQRRNFEEVAKILLACSTATLAIIVFIFFQREFFSSRFIILTSFVLSFIFVSVAHLLVRTIQTSLYKKGIGIHRLVIVGEDKLTDDFVKHIYQLPSLGWKIVDRFKNFDEQVKNILNQMAETDKIDEIILTDSQLPKSATLDLIDFCNNYHLTFKYAADLLDTQATNVEVHTIAGIPIIEIKRTPLEGWGKVSKRIFDIVLSLLIALILSPVFMIVSIVIKIDSQGPVLASLQRVGRGGKVFTLYKFRSMVKDAHSQKKDLMAYNQRKDGPLFKMKDDPRITRVGHFLRRSSLDEFPQMINILKGDMSLVGPRPHEPEEVASYQKHHKKVLTIKPGLTGLAQISGRSDLNFEDEVKLDTYYIENWSLAKDIKIIIKTPLILLISRKAA